MNALLSSISYIFHPIFLSFYGVCIYYFTTVKYYPQQYIQGRLLQIFVLTIIIPILIFRILKKLKHASSFMMENVQERKIPYAIAVLLNGYITLYIFKENQPELHYFFTAITFTSITFLILSLLNYKASLHAGAISGITMYTAALSVHYQLNLIPLLGALLLLNGLIATSRLHLKAHTKIELVIGFVLGLFPQFIMMAYWV